MTHSLAYLFILSIPQTYKAILDLWPTYYSVYHQFHKLTHVQSYDYNCRYPNNFQTRSNMSVQLVAQYNQQSMKSQICFTVICKSLRPTWFLKINVTHSHETSANSFWGIYIIWKLQILLIILVFKWRLSSRKYWSCGHLKLLLWENGSGRFYLPFCIFP